MGLNFSDCYEKKRKENDADDRNKLSLKTSKNISEGVNSNRLKEETTTLEDERLNSNQSASDTPRKKVMADKFVLNYSSSSNLDHSYSNILLDLDNKFFTFDQSYKQNYILSKSFNNIKSSEFLKRIDEFFEKEQECHSKTSMSDLSIEAIIEKVYSDSNFSRSQSSSGLIQNTSNASDNSKKKFSFIVISNAALYDLEYQTCDSGSLNLKRKIYLLSVEFFSITSDHMKLIIHVNPKLDKNGNFGITHEHSVQICFCLASMINIMSKNKKSLIVVPKSKMLVDKIKYISSLEKYKEVCNQYATELYKSLGQTIPYDNNESLIKLIPLSKIESKFTEVFCDKILVVTNKKVIELNTEFVDNARISIIPYNKLKKLNLATKNHKVQLTTEDDVCFQYSTLYAKAVFELVRMSHSKECLSELEVTVS